MARLIAADIPAGAEARGLRLVPVEAGPIVSVAPFRGRLDDVSEALGAAFPDPGTAVRLGAGWCVWSGRGQAMLLGADVAAPEGCAAVVDQSDGWAVFDLEGAAGPDVLARLCPVDLWPAAFPEGAAARSLLGHMTALIWRTGPETVRLAVFRSMAASAVAEIGHAMRAVAARG